ncbi:hypothetical protein GOBAR_DD13626 [Gossypium barbadense]|nr:hypothetical protein GOBAR_DD13626 [Gossypium barbadense]
MREFGDEKTKITSQNKTYPEQKFVRASSSATGCKIKVVVECIRWSGVTCWSGVTNTFGEGKHEIQDGFEQPLNPIIAAVVGGGRVAASVMLVGGLFGKDGVMIMVHHRHHWTPSS